MFLASGWMPNIAKNFTGNLSLVLVTQTGETSPGPLCVTG
jgi:hypothetical protein